MSEYCVISTRNFSRKEVDEFGKVTILRKDIGLEIELKLDMDDPVEKKLYLVDEVIEYLTGIRSKLQEEFKRTPTKKST